MNYDAAESHTDGCDRLSVEKTLLPEPVYNADGQVLCSYKNLTHSP